MPVNPAAPVIDGIAGVTEIASIQPGVGAALIVTPPSEAAGAVEECARAGVRKVWLYRAVGTGCATVEAIAAAQAHELETVEGECPMMWLEKTEWYHGAHKALRRVLGRLPA